jgi:HSP20 family protein
MPIMTWRPYWETGLQDFMEEVERSFEDFFGRQTHSRSREERWLPPADVYETAAEVVVVMDLPGVDLQDIKVSVTGQMLTVEGERRREESAEAQAYIRKERMEGEFLRMIELPADVMNDKAKAAYKDGVLRVTISKAAYVLEKEIKIKVKGE